MRSLLFWDAAQHRLAECYQRFGTLDMLSQNDSNQLPAYTMQQPRRVETLLTLQQKSETTYISLIFFLTTLTEVILTITN
jgi:hypothetical protein